MTDDIEQVYAFMRDVIGTGMHLKGEDRLEMMLEISDWIRRLEYPLREQALDAMREGAWYGTGPLKAVVAEMENE